MDYNRLKEVIETNSLGISGLFKKLNINRGSFYYSIDKKTLKVETLEKICEALGINVLQFFPNNEIEYTNKSNKNRGLEVIHEEAPINFKEKYLQTLEKLNIANERLLDFTDPKKDIINKSKIRVKG
jgi:DNA-binding Xre family transcriptional regulator